MCVTKIASYLATCAMKKKELEDWVAKQPMRPLGLSIPECADDGSYAGKQCSGSQYVTTE